MKLRLTLAMTLLACVSLHAEEPVNHVTSTAEQSSELLEEGEDSFQYRCPGVAGYSVIYEGSHGRSWINFVYDSEQTDLMDAILNACSGEFPSKADDSLIWRGTMQDGNFIPYACILRMMSLVDGEQVENFVILQLAGAGSRVVGELAGEKGLAAAETMADQLCKFN